ncbi:S-layer homology domain-containing protein [Paenibacillus rhizovicinus]|uniref:S-layer homology domain-containing protein n=1 Tax=Paenibacillus rhizovicinus TaxID=2704463 RepID=A0A6C0P4K0_9BACL|nr:S-layer homology domain-containing protein [Paenibacillus rhizovicinus]QHW33377.1 S-layer homology domain-containing protein [Paenibacillus rhizovicinus]
MKKAMLKKAAVTSIALLTLAGGAGSAFADGKGNGHNERENGKQEDRNNGGKNNGNSNVNNKGNNGNGSGINLHFKDEQDLKWAMEYIIRLASKGVFNGYEDGTFKPQQQITRIESIVAAVRLMGLKEQAESQAEMSTKLNFKDADQLTKKYPWAVGYVAVALEKDLFNETDDAIQADKPATRLFAATLLVKALGLEAEAKAKVNSQLTFKDAKSIPAGSVGYVEVALEKNLITGYENNTFRPNQPVTRAELAALLDRTDEQLPDHDAAAITGTLKVSASAGSITVVKADNSEVALALDPNVFIFRNNVKATAAALKAGDEVLVRTYQNKVVFIEVTKAAADQVVTKDSGKFDSYKVNSSGRMTIISITKDLTTGGTQKYSYAVSPEVTVIGDAALLEVGQALELTLTNGVVTAIKVVS